MKIIAASYDVIVAGVQRAIIRRSQYPGDACNWSIIDRRTRQLVWDEKAMANVFTLDDAKKLAEDLFK